MVEVGNTVYFMHENKVARALVYAIRTVTIFRGSVDENKRKFLTEFGGDDSITYSTEYGQVAAWRCYLSKEELLKSL